MSALFGSRTLRILELSSFSASAETEWPCGFCSLLGKATRFQA